MRAALLAAALLAAACASLQGHKVSGSARYEPVRLPPGAVLEVTLEDVSRAGAKAEVLGSTRVENPGPPPVAFEIPYDAARIDPRYRYAVRARVVADGRLLLTTDRVYPVLTSGHGRTVDLQLRRTSVSLHAGDEPLEGTYWKLVRLGEQAVTPAPNQREAHFVLHRADARVSGSGGCNGIGGGYRLDGERLSFGRMIRTMMACPVGMDTENDFLAALERTRSARVSGMRLELADQAGRPLAAFEAVHLR